MILYVTSFNEKLYESTGKEMLKSLRETNPTARVLVTYEGFDFVPSSEYEIPYNLDNDLWLKSWTNKWKDYIPQKYGGVEKPNIKHNISNHFPQRIKGNDPKTIQRKEKVLLFREQAARWFRKIVALRASTKYINPEMVRYIVFVDSDTLFKREIPVSLIEKSMESQCAFIHYGTQRINLDIGIESGFIGFDIFNGGLHYLEKVFHCYDSGEFLEYKRWDDSYVLAKIIQLKNIRVNDLIKVHIREAGGHVVKHGPFAPYIEHKKGIHSRTNII